MPKTEWEELKRRCAALEDSLREATAQEGNVSRHQQQHVLSPVAVHNIPAMTSTSSSRAETSTIDEDSQPTEGRLLHDADGIARYLGETSGATFLDIVKNFMTTVVPLAFNQNPPYQAAVGATFLQSVGRYQTFDSRRLCLPVHVDPIWLPSRPEMTIMLAELRYFIQDNNGNFPSGGIFFWGDMTGLPQDPRMSHLTATTVGSPEAGEGQRHLAFFHAAFAFATQLRLTTLNSKQDGQLGETFFARARALLGNPLDITKYTGNDVSVLVMMGLYLVENNRRDAAYIYISNAMHISIMHGVHRGWSVDEMGKRVFWTVYILDRWLSCLMGRPPTILDDAIRLTMPQDLPGLPSAAGLRAHIELARITGYIVCNSYRVTQRGRSANRVESYVHGALQLLSDWRASLPVCLQIRDDAFGNDRACCALHMAQGQLIILTIRPILFMAVKKAVADRFVSRQWSIEDHPQIQLIRECSDTARRNLRLGRWIRDISPSHKLLLPDLHHIFNAAIVLMLHQIVFVNLRTNDVSDITFAIDSFDREAGTGSNYGKDCAKVLQDLSALVHGLRSAMFESMAVVGRGDNVPIPGEQILASYSGQGGAAFTTGPGPGGGDAHLNQGAAAAAPQFPLPPPPAGEALYQELVAWIDNDDMQLYNNFLV